MSNVPETEGFWFELSDISLEEETEEYSDGSGGQITASVRWFASIDSRLRMGGISPTPYKAANVAMSRSGPTARAAIEALTEAVEAQGWRILR